MDGKGGRKEGEKGRGGGRGREGKKEREGCPLSEILNTPPLPAQYFPCGPKCLYTVQITMFLITEKTNLYNYDIKSI